MLLLFSRLVTRTTVGNGLERFDSRFTGVTGDRQSLDPLLRALGVTVMVQQLPGQPDYTVTHNGTIYVIGPDASLIATMSGSPPAAVIASDFHRITELYRRGRKSSTGA